VCYAHEDSDAVFREIAWLNDQGVNFWYDEGISPGHEWREELAAAIQGCARVFLFVTPRSVASEHCRRELNFAQEEDREIVAIHLQATEVPAGLRLGLNNRQAILRPELSGEEFHERLMRAAQANDQVLAHPLPQPPTASKRGLGIAVLVVVALVGILAVWRLTSQPQSSPADDAIAEPATELIPAAAEVLNNSIAVLPFDNLSPDPDNAYFAAGMHEEVLNQLAKIADLSVIARTTMLRYSGADKSVPEIAEELSVGTVMEGSVRYSGDRVRITAQLIDAASGTHLWSEAFEENLDDTFRIQLAIATRIARALEVNFSAGEQARVAIRPTDDPAAYAHYLRAVSSWGNYAPTGPMQEAIDAAIAQDPQFAAALAFKAFLHTVEGLVGPPFVEPGFDAGEQRQLLSQAQNYATQALEIDSNQAHAHWVLGWTHAYKREWEASHRRFDRAVALNSNDPMVLNGAAWASLIRGEIDASVQFMERSIALNPGDVASQGNFSQLLYWSERYEDLKRQQSLMISLLPDKSGPYAMLAIVASILGDSESMRVNAAIAEKAPGTPYLGLAVAFSRIGDDMNARRLLAAAEAERQGSSSRSAIRHGYEGYFVHVALKEYDAALDYLESAIDDGFPWEAARDVRFLSHHAAFDPVRGHPRFPELVRKSGLPLDRG
jgi:TolB-like protein